MQKINKKKVKKVTLKVLTIGKNIIKDFFIGLRNALLALKKYINEAPERAKVRRAKQLERLKTDLAIEKERSKLRKLRSDLRDSRQKNSTNFVSDSGDFFKNSTYVQDSGDFFKITNLKQKSLKKF